MILTGKAKEDFENYVLNKNLGHDSEVLISVYNQETLFIDYKDYQYKAIKKANEIYNNKN